MIDLTLAHYYVVVLRDTALTLTPYPDSAFMFTLFARGVRERREEGDANFRSLRRLLFDRLS